MAPFVTRLRHRGYFGGFQFCIEIPHYERVAVFELLHTMEQRRRFVVAPDSLPLKVFLHPAGCIAFSCMLAFWVNAGRDSAGVEIGAICGTPVGAQNTTEVPGFSRTKFLSNSDTAAHTLIERHGPSALS